MTLPAVRLVGCPWCTDPPALSCTHCHGEGVAPDSVPALLLPPPWPEGEAPGVGQMAITIAKVQEDLRRLDALGGPGEAGRWLRRALRLVAVDAGALVWSNLLVMEDTPATRRAWDRLDALRQQVASMVREASHA